jgi:hypothetical protein
MGRASSLVCRSRITGTRAAAADAKANRQELSLWEEKMERFLLSGALLLAVATLGPITRFVRFWARCAKRRHQEAMIYLAYERALITKAEIDTMLKQVDEFDSSCLSVIAERKRQWQQQHGEDERGISPRAILSRDLRRG